MSTTAYTAAKAPPPLGDAVRQRIKDLAGQSRRDVTCADFQDISGTPRVTEQLIVLAGIGWLTQTIRRGERTWTINTGAVPGL